MDDPTKDTIPRSAVEYCLRKETVNTNPDAYESHERFIAYMDDPDISQFGHWMHSNGFNCALVSIAVDLDKIPSVTPSAQPSVSKEEMVGDTISRQAAIDMLKNRWKKTRNYEGIGDDIAEECELYLKQVPPVTPKQPGWIPVTERLPKPKEYVNGVRKHYLVQNEYGDMMVCSWDGCFWTQMYRITHVKNKVAAWMPLPTPYREGGQDGNT